MSGNSKWRIVTDRRSKAYDQFYVDLKDNIPSNWRKCNKCSHFLQCKSTTTTSMMNHWKLCSTKENQNPNQPDNVSEIQIQRTSSSQVHYGLHEAAALVYENHFPTTAVANTKNLFNKGLCCIFEGSVQRTYNC